MTIKQTLIGKKIYISISLGVGKQWKIKTPLVIDPNDWNNTQGYPKNYSRYARYKQIKDDLDDIRAEIELNHHNLIKSGEIPNKEFYKTIIDKYFNKTNDEDSFITYIQKYIDDSPYRQTQLGIGVSESRIKSLKVFKKTWDRFELSQDNQYNIQHINKKVSVLFTNWLRSHQYSDEYIFKNISNLQAVMRESVKNYDVTLAINPDHIHAPRPGKKDKEEIIYLNLDEIKMIQDVNIKQKYLQNARKWLIMGCYIGQRGGDLLNLTPNNIQILNGKKCFVMKQQKTKKDTIVPILPEVEVLLNDGFPTKISIEKFRSYIKEVCRIAGIDELTIGRIKHSSRGATTKGIYPKWQLISTHVCRRSFASNFYGKIPTPILMRITNHSSERQFQQYIGVPEYEQVLEIFNYV